MKAPSPLPAVPRKRSHTQILPVIPAQAGIQEVVSDDVGVKVTPLRVQGLDERKFPDTLPFLDGFLAHDGRLHCFVLLEPDQDVNTVFPGKARSKIVLVLPDALNKIGGHASIERTVLAAGEDIDAWLFHGGSLLDSGLRRNDGLGEICVYGIKVEAA